jgi:hypothetical protein
VGFGTPSDRLKATNFLQVDASPHTTAAVDTFIHIPYNGIRGAINGELAFGSVPKSEVVNA